MKVDNSPLVWHVPPLIQGLELQGSAKKIKEKGNMKNERWLSRRQTHVGKVSSITLIDFNPTFLINLVMKKLSTLP